MGQSSRPRRSVLFMPGDNSRAMEKAKGLHADAIVFDLEDAVDPASKEQARAAVVDAVRGGGYAPREVVVRVNGLDTPWGRDDLAAICSVRPDSILLPKVESVATVLAALELAGHAAPEAGTDLWAMIETARGVEHVQEIATSTRQLGVLVAGVNDLSRDLGVRTIPGRLPIQTFLSLIVLAARAEGLGVLDGVYNDIGNEDGFLAECRQGRDLGFDGKTLIHPSQIDQANSVFGPSEGDIEEAERVVAAFEKARAEGKGIAVVDGRMIEALDAESARRTLERAAAIAKLANLAN